MSRARDIANLQSGGVINDASADLDFRIESGGNANMLFVDGGNDVLVIGQNAPDTTISGGKPAFQVIGSGFDGMAAITRRDSGVYGPALILSKSKSTTPDNYSIVANGDTLGGITFIGDDGTNLDTYGATIQAVVDGTPGENDMPTRLVFSTTADGAASPTERMRIDNSGNVGVAMTPDSAVKLSVSGAIGPTNGSESAPTHTFYSDADTGMFRAAANTLAFSTGGSERIRIDSTGNVGINTTSTPKRLNIVGNSTYYPLSLDSTNTDYAMEFSRNGTSEWWLKASSSVFQIHENGVGDHFTVNSSGGVGIGSTNSESYPLFVKGSNISSGGGLATLCLLDSGTAYNGTNPGGGVTFRGKYNNGGSTTNFATVQGIKENTTDGNYATALRFTTRANGGNLIERLRLASGGKVYTCDTSGGNPHRFLVSNRVSIAPNGSKTHTITGMYQGYATLKIGYSDGNAQYAHFVAELGGHMYSSSNGYNATVVANSASTMSISVTKNNASYVVTVNAGSNFAYGSIELSGGAFNVSTGASYAFS